MKLLTVSIGPHSTKKLNLINNKICFHAENIFIQLCYFVCKESNKVIAESYVILSVSVYKEVSTWYCTD